jgi:CheY-like chemotaxis protein
MPEGATVLVVDDNAMSRELAHDLLEDAGYDVRLASTAEAAIALAERDRPAVIVLDWHLKGTTGADVLRAVRGADAPRTAVLVVTADIRPDVRALALAAGADAVMTKPYRARGLLEAVAGLAAGATDAAGEEC